MNNKFTKSPKRILNETNFNKFKSLMAHLGVCWVFTHSLKCKAAFFVKRIKLIDIVVGSCFYQIKGICFAVKWKV